MPDIIEVTPNGQYYPQVLKLRYISFFQEYGLPEAVVQDQLELRSRHFALVEHSRVVACGRLTNIDYAVYKISQMAVSAEKQRLGLGSALLKSIISAAQHSGGDKIVLNARIPCVPFYRKHGFFESGKIFLSATTKLPHQPMMSRV